ncbi:helix-turn-helix domain-containing protein [Nonomuraea rhizosphaerae]|uniref:helix-turn-helix domain-containing protein n=1 Tax=Nonomuraea rhizosphaerae TaxID=2665663 RepID=UPI0027E2510B|nr:helix-turn-helix transcriptional regulator [Nonomuraea rhizosphaerae]
MERFAKELRRWRSSRRVSQLELANRAGTTQRHLSFMEQGRSHPGRGIVVRLAESLELSLRERNGLLLAAGYAPLFPEPGLDDAMLKPVREALDDILDGHLPYPAVVVRPYGELVAANAAFAVLTEGVAEELLRPPVNVLRVALHPRGMALRVLNLADWGRHIVESLRSEALRLLTTLTSFATAVDVTLAELKLEAFLPADAATADHLRSRHG